MDKETSDFAKLYHIVLSGIFLIIPFLPLFNVRSFNRQGEETSYDTYFLFDSDPTDLFKIPLFYLPLMYIIVLLLLTSSISIIMQYLVKSNNNNRIYKLASPIIAIFPLIIAMDISIRITVIGIIFFGIYYLLTKNHNYLRLVPIVSISLALYLIDEELRRPFIDGAYNSRTMFENVVPMSIGYIMLLILMIMIIDLRKFDYYQTFEEYKINLKKNILAKIKGVWGPTTAQYVGFHITSLIIMMVTYGMAFSNSNVNPLYAPIYYMQIVYSYGLNSTIELPNWIDYFAYLLAPMVLTMFSFLVFTMKAGGFAPNGPGIEITAPESRLYEITRLEFQSWSYFSMDVPLAEIYYFNNPKLNQFYIYNMFLAIILGYIIGSILRYYFFKNEQGAKFKSYFKLYLIFAIFLGTTIGTLSAPLIVVPGGIIGNIFNTKENFRNKNRFLLYKYLLIDHRDNGNYHPITVIWALLIFSIPIMLIGVLIDIVIGKLLSGDYFKKSVNQQIEGRVINEKHSKLPWD